MMKRFKWFLGSIMGLVALLLVLQTIASERIEVVELHTLNELGEEVTTRLWVVDDDGYQYLRVGATGSDWFTRLQANNEFDVTRNDRRYTYTAELREEKSLGINALMQEKYTWGDTFFAIMTGSREGSIPVELHLAN
ncbi:MAG: hypothetical protein P8N11_02515 [Gammaproteobacteria bacterium]|jgi:hypothetical protein|nr:hypothetical protein [Gammaproteobacteria bacterium]